MSVKRKEREAPELGGAAIRMVRALLRRAEAGDWEALEQLAMLELFTARAVGEALHRMHDGEGVNYSWAELGGVLGITRQSAQQRAAAWVTQHTTQ